MIEGNIKQERERGSEKEREREIATVRARTREVIIISNTPAMRRSEKGQERVGQRQMKQRDVYTSTSQLPGEKEKKRDKHRQ